MMHLTETCVTGFTSSQGCSALGLEHSLWNVSGWGSNEIN